jgi:hypothetical protein
MAGEISGHDRTGVGIDNWGDFTMNGGTISGNTNLNGDTNRSGGGVRVGTVDPTANKQRGTFTMKGGEITGNRSI